MREIREEKVRRPAPVKDRSNRTREAPPKSKGWKVLRMEYPAEQTSSVNATTSTVAGYVDKSESVCRAKANDLNAKVKLGPNVPIVSYIAVKIGMIDKIVRS